MYLLLNTSYAYDQELARIWAGITSNWSEEPLDDKDYNDIVKAIQEVDGKIMMFMFLES